MTNFENKMEEYLEKHFIKMPKTTFRSYVLERIALLLDERQFPKECSIYQRGNIDRRVHNRLKHASDAYRPHKTMAMAYSLALGLSVKEAEELLYLAGYHFEDGCLTDQIVKYCLEKGIYSADVVNNEICYFAERYGIERVELIGSVVRE